MDWVLLLARGIPITIAMWAMAFSIAVTLGVPVAMLRMSKYSVLRAIASVWIAVLRGIPSLMWIFIFFFGVNLGYFQPTPLVAAGVALGVIGSAFMAENYRSALSSLPRGQSEASAALGMKPTTILVKILLPQCFPVVLASSASYAIHLVKDTAVASLIGVIDITFLANDLLHRGVNGLLVMLTAGLFYVLLSVPLAYITRVVTQRFRIPATVEQATA